MQALAPDFPLKTKACKTLLDAWLAWRGNRLQPDHADVDPVALKWALSRIGVLEIRSRDVAVYRVAGTALRDTIGFDPTGRNAVALAATGSARNRRGYRLHELIHRPCAYRAETQFTYSTGLVDTFESIGLPLRSERGEIAGLVIFAMESIVGRRWQNTGGSSLIDTVNETFEFLDIGAGVPGQFDPATGYSDPVELS